MRTRLTLAWVAALSLGLSGCGQPAVDTYVKTAPATIDQDLRHALTALRSVHVHTVQNVGSSRFVMDISVDTAGRCIGTLAQGAQRLTLIGLGGTKVYAKGSADFWSAAEGANASEAAALADRWVTGLPSGMFSNTCDITSLVHSITKNSVASDKPKVLGKTKVGNRDAVTLQISLNGSPATIAVDAESPHRPLRLTSVGGKLTTVLSEFDVPLRPAAPANATDLSTLSGTK